jgi:Tfp pilus assembly protein PilO
LFREKKQILIFIIATVIFGGFVLFRYIPMTKEMSAAKSARAEQNLIIAKAISDSEQLPVFTDQLHKLQEELDNYEANIPRQKDLGLFLKKIAELMDNHNLKDQAIQPLEETKINELICIPVSMECKGNLTQIFEFYKNLQELDRQMRIKQVKLKNGTDYSGEVKMETQIVIYYRTQVG